MYISHTGTNYQLGSVVGSGGEGTVYRVIGKPLAAKIYKEPDERIFEKLLYMLNNPIADIPYANGISFFSLRLAWPIDILYSESKQFLGYVMPMIEGDLELITIDRGFNSKSDKETLPNYNRAFHVIVACNLAKAMAYLHQHNCIIGDLNPKNILVTANGGIVLLDADSFDILDEEKGIHHRCCVGTEDYLAPELQGRNLRAPNTVFSVYSDCFSLAVHIFQLLMINYHPFTGVDLIQVKNSSFINKRVDRIARGISPFVHTYTDVAIPVGAPVLEEMLPGYLIADFYQTFCYTEPEIRLVEKNRTTAAQWAADMERFLEEIYDPYQCCTCAKDRTHFYLRSQGECGFCKAKHRADAYYHPKKSIFR